MDGNKPLNRCNRFFVVLLVLSVALNGTQAIVLCMGSDQHVAIEMAGHHHCHSEHESEEASHESNDSNDELDPPCQPCVDVPLSPGISDGSIAQKIQAMVVFFADITLPNQMLADQDLETDVALEAGSAIASFYDPLSSIILIV